MRVAVTGTPGAGKTTAVERVETGLDVIHLNELIREDGLYGDRDERRDSLVADLDAVRERLAGRADLLVESHLAHHLDADRVVVLRCHPDELYRRLRRREESGGTAGTDAIRKDVDREEPARNGPAEDDDGRAVPGGRSTPKGRENAASEALDVILAEAVRRHGRARVYEIDTTGRTPADVAAEIEAVVAGEREPAAGIVDFSDTLDVTDTREGDDEDTIERDT